MRISVPYRRGLEGKVASLCQADIHYSCSGDFKVLRNWPELAAHVVCYAMRPDCAHKCTLLAWRATICRLIIFKLVLE